MPKDSTGLNERQKRFCEEYVIDLNATAAYIRAGYRAKNDNVAAVSASDLLRNPKIESYIQQLRRQQQERTGITADRVLEEYARVAFANITDVVTFNQNGLELKDSQRLSEETKSAIASITVIVTEGESGVTRKHSVKMHDKLKALEFTADYLGLRDDLHKAIATFRKYGYNPRQTESGYEMIDSYGSDSTPEAT